MSSKGEKNKKSEPISNEEGKKENEKEEKDSKKEEDSNKNEPNYSDLYEDEKSEKVLFPDFYYEVKESQKSTSDQDLPKDKDKKKENICEIANSLKNANIHKMIEKVKFSKKIKNVNSRKILKNVNIGKTNIRKKIIGKNVKKNLKKNRRFVCNRELKAVGKFALLNFSLSLENYRQNCNNDDDDDDERISDKDIEAISQISSNKVFRRNYGHFSTFNFISTNDVTI
jgi:hypothetical protein